MKGIIEDISQIPKHNCHVHFGLKYPVLNNKNRIHKKIRNELIKLIALSKISKVMRGKQK